MDEIFRKSPNGKDGQADTHMMSRLKRGEGCCCQGIREEEERGNTLRQLNSSKSHTRQVVLPPFYR